MKFKKFLMTMACMVLIVAATFGFAGCAKEVSAEDVKTFMQTAEIDGVFDAGYAVKANMFGTSVDAKMLFDENGHVSAAYMKGSEDIGEMWLVDGTLYVNNNGKRKYVFANLAESNPLKQAFNQVMNETPDFNLDYLTEFIDDYQNQKESGVKVTFKKDGSGNNVTFLMNVSGEEFGVKFSAEGKIAFKNNKLTKVSLYSKMGNEVSMDMSVEAFNGTISAPADAASYQ